MAESSKIEVVENITQKLLESLDVAAQVSVSADDEEGLQVALSGGDLGILIGYHGETLSSLQLVLNLMLYRRLGEWQPVFLDAGGYRKERQAKIGGMARRTADRVRFLQTPVTLPPMPAFERRLVHVALAGESGVTTESVGEGGERMVVVKPS